jgi:hypothetical protein
MYLMPQDCTAKNDWNVIEKRFKIKEENFGNIFILSCFSK